MKSRSQSTRINGVFSLLDQIVVSGSRFAITLLIIRAAGNASLGIYGLVMSLVYLVLVGQQTLITTPFANFRHRNQQVPAKTYFGAIWIASFVLAVMAGLLIALVGLVLSYWGTDSGTGAEIASLASGFLWASLATPAVMQVEFFRRVLLIKLQSRSALILDSMVWPTSVVVFVMIWINHELTLSLVFCWLGIISTAATCLCIFWFRPFTVVSKTVAQSLCYQHWTFGKWILFSEGTTLGKSNLIKWIISGFLGLGATGIYEACHSLMRAVNPYFLAVTNVAEPTLAKAFAESGHRAVKQIAYQVLFIMLIGTLPICLTIGFGSQWALEFLYSASVAEHWRVVAWLAASSFLFSMGYPFANSLQAIDRPHINFWIRALSFVVVVLGAYLAAPIWGIVGVAACFFAGTVVSLCCRIYFFYHYFKTPLGSEKDELTNSALVKPLPETR